MFHKTRKINGDLVNNILERQIKKKYVPTSSNLLPEITHDVNDQSKSIFPLIEQNHTFTLLKIQIIQKKLYLG